MGRLWPNPRVCVCRLRRSDECDGKSRRRGRAFVERDGLGVHACTGRPLGSADHDFPHAGLPVLRARSLGASSDECPAPCGFGDAAVSAAAGDDLGLLAQRVCGGGLCRASAARGIGGLDHGAEGCAERAVLSADAVGLCLVCAPAWGAGEIPSRDRFIRRGTDVQGDDRHAARGAALTRLLAAAPHRAACQCQWQAAAADDRHQAFLAAGSGKDPALCPLGRLRCGADDFGEGDDCDAG